MGIERTQLMLFFTHEPEKKKIKGPPRNLRTEWIPRQCWQKHHLGWKPGGSVLTGRGLFAFLVRDTWTFFLLR